MNGQLDSRSRQTNVVARIALTQLSSLLLILLGGLYAVGSALTIVPLIDADLPLAVALQTTSLEQVLLRGLSVIASPVGLAITLACLIQLWLIRLAHLRSNREPDEETARQLAIRSAKRSLLFDSAETPAEIRQINRQMKLLLYRHYLRVYWKPAAYFAILVVGLLLASYAAALSVAVLATAAFAAYWRWSWGRGQMPSPVAAIGLCYLAVISAIGIQIIIYPLPLPEASVQMKSGKKASTFPVIGKNGDTWEFVVEKSIWIVPQHEIERLTIKKAKNESPPGLIDVFQ